MKWMSIDHLVEADGSMQRTEWGTMIGATLWVALFQHLRGPLTGGEAAMLVAGLLIAVPFQFYWDLQAALAWALGPMGRRMLLVRFLTRAVPIGLGTVSVLLLAHGAWSASLAMLVSMLVAAPTISTVLAIAALRTMHYRDLRGGLEADQKVLAEGA